MRTRTKIMIALFTSTLALGVLVLLYASDDVLRRFRWFLFNDPLQLIADVTLGLRTSNGLWYGCISLGRDGHGRISHQVGHERRTDEHSVIDWLQRRFLRLSWKRCCRIRYGRRSTHGEQKTPP